MLLQFNQIQAWFPFRKPSHCQGCRCHRQPKGIKFTTSKRLLRKGPASVQEARASFCLRIRGKSQHLNLLSPKADFSVNPIVASVTVALAWHSSAVIVTGRSANFPLRNRFDPYDRILRSHLYCRYDRRTSCNRAFLCGVWQGLGQFRKAEKWLSQKSSFTVEWLCF